LARIKERGNGGQQNESARVAADYQNSCYHTGIVQVKINFEGVWKQLKMKEIARDGWDEFRGKWQTRKSGRLHTRTTLGLGTWRQRKFQELMRRENLNAPERIHRQEVRIASDNMCSLAADGELKDLVVLWIAASGDLHVNVNPFCLARQGREKASNVFLTHLPAELLSIQHFIEFGERGEGKQDCSFSESQVKRLARL